MSQVNITINSDKPLTKAEVRNAVRRAFDNDEALVEGQSAVVKGVSFRVRNAPKAVSKVTLAPVRKWAKKQGIELGKRGRIPASVLAAYTETISE
jgi:hypothetical protein